MVEVKIVNKSGFDLPVYAKPGDSGVDIKAMLDTPSIKLKPLERALIPTGIYVEIPEGYEIQIRPRSGLSAKKGLVAVLGTIDSGYRGEIKVILVNLDSSEQEVLNGERIAQMVLAKVEEISWAVKTGLSESERGEGGFGHSGIL